MSTKPIHPALQLMGEERSDYAVAVTSLAFADGNVDEREVAQLKRLGEAWELPAGHIDLILAAARQPDLPTVMAMVKRWNDQPIGISLFTDALVIAFADRRLDASETEKLAALAKTLGVAPDIANKIAQGVEGVAQAQGADAASSAQLIQKLGADLEAAGVSSGGGPIGWLLSKLRG